MNGKTPARHASGDLSPVDEQPTLCMCRAGSIDSIKITAAPGTKRRRRAFFVCFGEPMPNDAQASRSGHGFIGHRVLGERPLKRQKPKYFQLPNSLTLYSLEFLNRFRAKIAKPTVTK
jgi:hypothetical protein